MPETNDAPNIQHAYVLKGGKKVPIKLRHVSLDDLERRNASRREEEVIAESAAQAEAEKTVDVAEVQREVRKREKSAGDS